MKYIFIINPKSGKKDSTEYIRNYLEQNYSDLNYEIYNTKAIGDATEYVKVKCSNKDEPITFIACLAFACVFAPVPPFAMHTTSFEPSHN